LSASEHGAPGRAKLENTTSFEAVKLAFSSLAFWRFRGFAIWHGLCNLPWHGRGCPDGRSQREIHQCRFNTFAQKALASVTALFASFVLISPRFGPSCDRLNRQQPTSIQENFDAFTNSSTAGKMIGLISAVRQLAARHRRRRPGFVA
jgi:hypothetical protein